ncbi:MAG: hypothetical protein J0H79_15530 [Alphaproteobacteria bacterium]|nr:hypothetical protein [Alphaproteobacteria bacterium]
MKGPRSSKSLFRAISGRGSREKVHRETGLAGLEIEEVPQAPEERRALDLYPTGEPEAIRGLLARDGARIRALGRVWEPAAGYGHLSHEIEAFGLPCAVSDVADHGCPGVEVRSFYDYHRALAPAIITNPPYAEINARDGHGRWLRHTLEMPGWSYCALLLSWDWPAARANGLGALLDRHPFSYCYLMRWKLDFTGEGSPPQRNAWFIWDRDWTGSEPAFRFMDRTDGERLKMADLFA